MRNSQEMLGAIPEGKCHFEDVRIENPEAESFLANCQTLSYSRTSQTFVEPQSSLPCSQEDSIGPYPEPDESSQYHTILFV
jgi:hypothetical protein